jgi:hypothetical protein
MSNTARHAHARRTKEGSLRNRVAGAAALAVLVIPMLLVSLIGSPDASARVRQEAVSHHPAAHISMKLMSYAQAVKVAKLATFYNAITNQEVDTYLQEGAFLEAVAQANTMPAAWEATATCEEGGRNDPYAGYFGILEWNGFDGYPTAGSAPLSVQLAWESAHGISPPDAPGQCHGY